MLGYSYGGEVGGGGREKERERERSMCFYTVVKMVCYFISIIAALKFILCVPSAAEAAKRC